MLTVGLPITSFTVSGDIKKKKKALKIFKKKKFQSFFIYFFCPRSLIWKKKSRKSTNKKILA